MYLLVVQSGTAFVPKLIKFVINMTIFVIESSAQGSTKWLSRLSKITETPISHGNFSLEIMYKMPQKGYF